MTKQEVIETILKCLHDKNLREVGKSAGEFAYDKGFEEGMRRATEVTMKTMELLDQARIVRERKAV